MRRKIVRVAGIGFAVLLTAQFVSCRIYDAVALPVEPEGLVRNAVETPSGWTVSYLQPAASAPELPRVIYVHGTPGDATAFDDYLLDPVPGLDPISIDRPGFGHTRPKRPAVTLAEQALSLKPFLVERSGVKPILVGHSLGAPIVAQAAVDFPELVGAIVLLSGSLDPALERVAWYQRLVDFAFIPYLIPRFLRNTNRELIPLKQTLEMLEPRLAGIRCPVVIVHAPNDQLVPFENVAFMKARIPEDRIVEVVVLEGKNHFIPWNAESDVRAAIVSAYDAMMSLPKEESGAVPATD